MVVLSRTLRHATNCIYCPYLAQSLRAFHGSCVAFDEQVASTPAISSRKITRKKLLDLPTARILPDGTFATPLGDWPGGIGSKAAPRRLAQASDGLESKVPSSAGVKRNQKPSKRRVKDFMSVEECSSDVQASGSEENSDHLEPKSSEKPKRRKTKVESDEMTIEGAVAPKKRTLRKRVPKDLTDANDNLSGDGQSPVSVASTPTPKKSRKRIPKPNILSDDLDLDTQPRNQLAREILENLNKFPHCILLTRVGQFYESYFDQAIEVAGLLNIKLASRKWDSQRIPMCGFPLMHIDKHLKVLVQQNKRFVAMCEEFPRFSNFGAKEFDRRVVRVITPGTLIDEPFLNQYENNYLLAIDSPEGLEGTSSLDNYNPEQTGSPLVGLAWIDISTGEFTSKISKYESLRDELARINPREIVLDQRLQSEVSHPICQALEEEGNFVSYITPSKPTDRASLPRIEEGSAKDVSKQQGCLHDTEWVSLEPTLDTHTPDPQAIIEEGSSTTCASLPGTNAVPAQPDTREGIDETTKPPIHELSPSTPAFTIYETSAINLLTTYLHANLLEHMPSLSSPNREGNEGRMQIDSHTIKALEIREGMREGGTRGSLLSVIKRTVTSSGTRLLARWLCSPSTSIPEINARQSLVAFLHSRPHFRADLLGALSKAEDVGRIVQRFLLGRGNSGDLLAINTTIDIWSSIKRRIEDERKLEQLEQSHFEANDWASLDALMFRMTDLGGLSDRIAMALEQGDFTRESSQISDTLGEDVIYAENDPQTWSPKLTWRYGLTKWSIKPEFSEKLTSLHATLKQLLRRREELEEELQKKFNAPSLTLRSSPAHGMHVHLARSKRDQIELNKSPDFLSIAESGTTKCYFHQDWSQLGGQIVETTLALNAAEKEAFEILRNEVKSHAPLLRRNARILDELDVTLAFANLASEMKFIRPLLTDDPSYFVVNGRHPTVELGLLTAGRVFTPNSVQLTSESRLHVITGPNMAGKSTLLRQTALIAILAQIGSFVPADSATLGIVDKLFSRVGAKDDLFHDRSTFMVEMLETSEILRRATPRSLVIMDEVGRGTTVKDGLAIAFATVHHLVFVNRCRALFATHFHELSDMLGYSSDQGVFRSVAFFCTDVDETDDGHFAYSYRVRPGVNRDSHGLKVAQLAGMPQPAMAVAKDTLAWLKSRHQDKSLSPTELSIMGRSFSNQ